MSSDMEGRMQDQIEGALSVNETQGRQLATLEAFVRKVYPGIYTYPWLFNCMLSSGLIDAEGRLLIDGETAPVDPLTAYETTAEKFHRETGYLAPGKDCRIHPYEVRSAAWDRWLGRGNGRQHEEDGDGY